MKQTFDSNQRMVARSINESNGEALLLTIYDAQDLMDLASSIWPNYCLVGDQFYGSCRSALCAIRHMNRFVNKTYDNALYANPDIQRSGEMPLTLFSTITPVPAYTAWMMKRSRSNRVGLYDMLEAVNHAAKSLKRSIAYSKELALHYEETTTITRSQWEHLVNNGLRMRYIIAHLPGLVSEFFSADHSYARGIRRELEDLANAMDVMTNALSFLNTGFTINPCLLLTETECTLDQLLAGPITFDRIGPRTFERFERAIICCTVNQSVIFSMLMTVLTKVANESRHGVVETDANGDGLVTDEIASLMSTSHSLKIVVNALKVIENYENNVL